MSGSQTLEPIGVARDPVDHPERRRVRAHRPEQRGLVAERPEVRQTITAVGEHHRQITDDPPHVVPRTPGLQARQLP